MIAITGLGMLIIDFFKTLVIDSVIKVLLYPEECYTPQIKIGGPMIDAIISV